MTDFCLIYRENGSRHYFFGEGVWDEQDRLAGYEIKIPGEIKFASNDRRTLVVQRVREYVERHGSRWHENVSIEQI